MDRSPNSLESGQNTAQAMMCLSGSSEALPLHHFSNIDSTCATTPIAWKTICCKTRNGALDARAPARIIHGIKYHFFMNGRRATF